MNSPITFRYRRFYLSVDTPCETISEAIRLAKACVNGEDGWPESILQGDEILWKQSGPFTTEDSLEEFAAKSV